jgi:phage terminase small subunit
MPNPGKSADLKQKLGSRAPALPTLTTEAVAKAPEPLRRLEESGLELWNSVWSNKHTWLKSTDIQLLQILCEQLDERDVLRAYVLENIEAWHERAALRTLDKDIRDNMTQLGFTPQARSKLGIQEVKTQSKFEELMARKEQRVASPMVDRSST